jgi:MFS family permease
VGDLFPVGRRTFPIAVYNLGSTLGAGLALIFGGAILEWAAHNSPLMLPLVGRIDGWQLVFLAIGIPGCILGLLVFTFPEPRRQAEKAAGPGWEEWKAFLRERGTVTALHFGTFGLAGLAASAMWFWAPEHMRRTFDWPLLQVGTSIGIILITAQPLSQLITGRLIDLLLNRGMADAPVKVYLAMVVAAMPVLMVMFGTSSPYLFLAALVWLALTAASFISIAISILLQITPVALRGQMTGAFISFMGILSFALGPALVGYITDNVFRNEADLGASLAIVMLVSFAIVLLGLLVMRRPLVRATAVTQIV